MLFTEHFANLAMCTPLHFLCNTITQICEIITNGRKIKGIFKERVDLGGFFFAKKYLINSTLFHISSHKNVRIYSFPRDLSDHFLRVEIRPVRFDLDQMVFLSFLLNNILSSLIWPSVFNENTLF